MPDTPEETTPSRTNSPLIFISHDSRDAEIANAFSKLLKSVSAGMLKTFRSSDKAGTEGIVFGDEWYKTIMTKLSEASDVVCLLTENSVERPWILYEAGVAKGKSSIPVHGLALGIPLSKTSTGPFYQFQNCDDSNEAIIKLVNQLCARIPGIEPDETVVKTQVSTFKETIAIYFQKKPPASTDTIPENCEKEQSLAKILEEIKATLRELPSLVSGPKIVNTTIRQEKQPISQVKSKKRLLQRLQKYAIKNEPIALLIIPSLVNDTHPFITNTCTALYNMVYDKKYKAAEDLAHGLRLLIEATLDECMDDFESDLDLRQSRFTQDVLRYIVELLTDLPRLSMLLRNTD
ncbi:toll/interleukin-1 receptor domain-containing protein [Solidesulfovibrio sp.]|uniref:toll/interleukin-1 receptor domain-containing protein n=1 Tax=Solidesulfovibrio sp. TaxID=2910990 RepID=UPI002B20A9B3|nr:toll/interleukin-1 receptor domain-containing protein [Solidesulfovibrio sp.]MEA4857238.1 toll/interleukin-1 receptor domain-containing protein [Solidesulfovibrio sp.]